MPHESLSFVYERKQSTGEKKKKQLKIRGTKRINRNRGRTFIITETK
jgi:hypothetical protein